MQSGFEFLIKKFIVLLNNYFPAVIDNKIVLITKGGLIAIAAMTILMLVAPMMGKPKMPIGGMLENFMHFSIAAGWVMHFMIGTVLAGGYILFFESNCPDLI